jgi:CO/xanthine dehydrogenase Mo-binding subunit
MTAAGDPGPDLLAPAVTLDVPAAAVGTSVRAQDAAERVDGRLEYAASFELPGMLHGKALRSIRPHARLLAVDAAPARALPGVVEVLVGADLADPSINAYYGPVFPDRPLVAVDRVRYAGEPVAVVIAEDPDTAEEALPLIEVAYEDLPAYVDVEEALAPGALAIHERARRREFLAFPDLVIDAGDAPNVCNRFRLRKGDLDEGFHQAQEIVEGVYRTPPLQHVSLEPHVAVCEISAGHARVWSSASSPFTARFQVAEVLNLPESRVRVVAWYVGGAFGGKTYPRIEPLAAAASWRVGGRPVRLEFSRAEEFATICRHAATVRLRTGVRRTGEITAREVTVLWNAGAYADISPRLAKNGGYSAAGPYRIANVSVDSLAVYTNTTPAGGFRGYGVPQVTWAYESQADEIAALLGLDPLELRRRNVVRPGDTFSTGQVMDDARYLELLGALERPAPRGGVRRRPGASTATGRGVAVTVKTTVTPSTSTASLELNEDGSVSLLASTTDVGQGARTVLAQIAADAVGVPYEAVRPSFADTELTPWDQTTSSSRSTISMGGAIAAAGAEIRAQLAQLGAAQLEVAVEDVEVADGHVRVRGAEARALAVGEVVARARRGNLLGSGRFASRGKLDADTGQGIATAVFHQAACAAEIAVDLETGAITPLSLQAVVYAGRVVHPVFAELQTQGSVTFGLGQALFEEIVSDGGQVTNASLAEYMIPSVLDLPVRLAVTHLEDAGPRPRIYGLGESAVPVVAPAIANALSDACGVRVRTLPLTPERVLRALRGLPPEGGA